MENAKNTDASVLQEKPSGDEHKYKQTFVTVMPNHIGAFLKASRYFAAAGINITRVSYNKAVDSHMLFIDAEGTRDQLKLVSEELERIGYLKCDKTGKNVILIEFRLKDIPGSVTRVLQVINDFNFNISYISSQENGTDHQLFKMGIVAEDKNKLNQFLTEARKLCEVRVIDYDHADKIYDNSLFYQNFVHELSQRMHIPATSQQALLVNTNLAMQQLDESGVSPYRTFDSISRFCELLSQSRAEHFAPRITRHDIGKDTELFLIEPPCGSNTAILHSRGEYLFVDTGYAYMSEEMNRLFAQLIPGYSSIKKQAFITHADVDHCGLLGEFDVIYAGAASAECLRLEYAGEEGYREQNPLHKPYIRICKTLTSYHPVAPEKMQVIGGTRTGDAPLEHTGSFDFGEMHFELYEGRGGHLCGENVLIDYEHHVVFSGDIYVNLKDMTAQQSQYNLYAPILMTSVDTDPALCKLERQALFARLGAGTWQIFGGHGGKKLYTLRPEE